MLKDLSLPDYFKPENYKIDEPVIQNFLKSFETGDSLPLYSGPWKRKSSYLSESIDNNLSSHPQGVVVIAGNGLWLNGKTMLYNGPYNDFFSHSKGLLVRRGNQYLLVRVGNQCLPRENLLYEGELDMRHIGYNYPMAHPRGMTIEIETETLAREVWLYCENGDKELLFKGDCDKIIYCDLGVIICRNDEFWLDNKILLYQGIINERIMSHPYGFMHWQDHKIFFNGNNLVCEFEHFTNLKSHHRGAIIMIGDGEADNNEIWFNMEFLLYKGKWNRCWVHPDGVIILLGEQIIFYPIPC